MAAMLWAGGAAAQDGAKDPYERFNRSMFAVHEAIDKYAAKPVAQAYDNVAPLPVKMGVGNFLAMPAICGSASIAPCRANLAMPASIWGVC